MYKRSQMTVTALDTYLMVDVDFTNSLSFITDLSVRILGRFEEQQEM